jgi:hypothetical protein
MGSFRKLYVLLRIFSHTFLGVVNGYLLVFTERKWPLEKCLRVLLFEILSLIHELHPVLLRAGLGHRGGIVDYRLEDMFGERRKRAESCQGVEQPLRLSNSKKIMIRSGSPSPFLLSRCLTQLQFLFVLSAR